MTVDTHESAEAHVTGTARYVDDIREPIGCCHVAIGLSEIAHGDLNTLNLDQVRAAPGVLDVITYEDIPGDGDVGAVFPGDPLLADNAVLYQGQAVFAVAAESYKAAQRAVALAEITYDERPPILTAADAHDKGQYVLPSRHWQTGDTESALTASPNMLEMSMLVGGQEHFYVEGQVALAMPTEAGGFDVYSSTQHPAEVQELIAKVLGVPMHGIQVICRRMGGGFGGKESQAASLACLSAVFAQRLGRAAKFRMPRRTDMLNTGKRHDFDCSYQLGYNDEGLLLAGDINLLARCGYSPDLSEGIVDRAMFHCTNAYYIPSTSIVSHRCKTNTVSNTAFRGFGGPQGVLPMEAAMDEIAARLDVDPLDVRKRNLYRSGATRTPYGQDVEQLVLLDIVKSLEDTAQYRERRAAIEAHNSAGGNKRRGIALTPVQFGISFTTTHLNQAGALVNLYLDGSVEVSHAGTEMGQGLYTKIRQIVAEEFGLSRDRVRNTATRTDKVPNGSPTAASAATDLNGMAAVDACQRIKQNLTAFAKTTLGWDTLTFVDGHAVGGSETLPFKDFLHKAYLARVHLSSTGFYRTPDIHFDKEAGRGRPFYYYANGAALSEVEVDITTGHHQLTQVDILHDCGKSLHPAIDQGQIEGGYLQGFGWLTSEELKWDDAGRALATGPANYKVPAAGDCPEIFNVEFFQGENTVPAIRRSKAVGEPPLMLAISAWCALRMACASLGPKGFLPRLAAPATPEAVYMAIQEAKAQRI